MKSQSTILIVSGKIAQQNSKIDWPDLNYPGTGQTILRTIHTIDYENFKIQLDSAEGPWFDIQTFPTGVGFYKKVWCI